MARIVGMNSVRVSAKQMAYTIEIDKVLASPPSVVFVIAYINGDKEQTREQKPMTNVSTSVANGITYVSGRIVLEEPAEKLMGYTASTGITVNAVRIVLQDPDTGTQTVEKELEDVLRPSKELTALVTPVSTEEAADSSLVAVIGNKYIFDGPVYKNLTELIYNAPDNPEKTDSEDGYSFSHREEERDGTKTVVRKSWKMAEPVRILERPYYIDEIKYQITANISDYLRMEATEEVAGNLSDQGYAQQFEEEGSLGWEAPYIYTAPDRWVNGEGNALGTPQMKIEQQVVSSYLDFAPVLVEGYEGIELEIDDRDIPEPLLHFVVDPEDYS